MIDIETKKPYIRPAYYINMQNVKKRIREHNRHASRDFLRAIDEIVEGVIDTSCRQWNGRRKRLNRLLIPKRYK